MDWSAVAVAVQGRMPQRTQWLPRMDGRAVAGAEPMVSVAVQVYRRVMAGFRQLEISFGQFTRKRQVKLYMQVLS
jgi:hypothetical protein